MRQVKRLFFSRATFIVGVFFIQSTQSSMAQKTDIEIGVGLMAFDYAEYWDDNSFLDGETGYMPGVILKRKQNHLRFYTELVGQLYGNTIQYDGQTQGGTPAKTDSVAIIFDSHFKLGMKLAEKHEPYIGVGYRYWYRNILNGYDVNGDAIAGLLEEYRWFYGILGYAAKFKASETVSVGFDLRYTKMFDAKMDIDFLGFNGYDNTNVNLGNESGARFAMPVKIKTKKHILIVTPYFEIIDIGKSNSVALTKNGGVPVTGCNPFDPLYPLDPCKIHEPRSETRNVGIEFTWLW